MNERIFILVVVVFIFFIVILSNNDNTTDLEDDVTANYYFPLREKEDEEMFRHPVTGYRGTKSNMDTYIKNRERKLKEER